MKSTSALDKPRPKSVMATCPSVLSSTFSGLRSLCRILWLCRNSIACTISAR